MTDELRSIRPLSKETLRGVDPSAVGKKLPRFEWVDPKTLYVEDAYQRTVGENGVALVRRIIAKFSWGRFKPPICVRLPDSGNVLVVIDGQHTATAAACHQGVPKIPVMVVDADDVASRADNFIGHNRERLALTNLAIYRADLVRGDPAAAAIDRACKAAGARILERHTSTREVLEPGTTVSVGTIRAILRRHGEKLLGDSLRVLTQAGRAPMLSDEIAAASIILAKAPKLADRLRGVIASKPPARWRSIAIARIADTSEKPAPALASCWLVELDGVPRPASTDAPLPPSPAKPSTPKAVPRQPERKTEIRPPAISVRPPPPPPREVAVDGATNRIVERNGVVLDLRDRTLTHRGQTINLTDDGVRLAAMLARVMPAFLPSDRLAAKVFGQKSDSQIMLKGLIERLNPVFGAVQLQVREIPKMGYMMADLGGQSP